MKTSIILSICLSLLLQSLSAQSSVWKVSDGDQVVYLGGTCHLLRPGDFPLPEEFESAYAQADTLFFEVDPGEIESPEFAARMMAAAVYRDGRTLKSVLSDDAYTALAAQGAKSNLPIELLQTTKPGVAIMMIAVQEMTKAGITQDGVDFFYARKAKADGKPIGSLETVDFQLDLITNLGAGMESEFVLYSLQDLDQMKDLLYETIQAWRQGDLEMIERLFNKDMEAFPEIYDLLLKDRNQRWVPQIVNMLDSEPTEFVLVGVGHMGGEHGLLRLLEAAGYSVEQIVAP